MKIDLHCHTKKTKSGETEKRTINPDKFADILSKNNVGIVSCTNHNNFSINDYALFSDASSKKGIVLWPGIELDVVVNNEKGHVIFICNPNKVDIFDAKVKSILGASSPDSFEKPIECVLEEFADLDLIIIAHNSMKDHGFSDTACDIIKNIVANKNPVLFEPSSLKSVGILFSHGISGFIGSDVKDWDNYPVDKVPDLKMEVNSFDTFKLLIKKDVQTIKTFVNQKKTDNVTIKPFSDEGDFTPVNLSLKEDVNIIYGGKGTGKTKIIDALKQHYDSQFGASLVKYYVGKTTNSEYANLVKRVPDSSKYLAIFNLGDYSNEIESIKSWTSSPLVTTDKFYKSFKDKNTKGSFSRFGFSKTTFRKIIEPNPFLNERNDYIHIIKGLEEVKKANLESLLSEKELKELKELFNILKMKSLKALEEKFISSKAAFLEKWTITTMQNIGLAKTGNHSIPPSTGILDLFTKRIELFNNSHHLLKAIETKHIELRENIGYLPNKGMVFLKTNIFLNPNESTSISYAAGKPSASILKKVLQDIKNIKSHTFEKDIGTYLKNFNKNAVDCYKLDDFLGIKTEQCIQSDDGTISVYSASSGEQCMLLLNNSIINDEAKVYLMDEPELSVGHKYINDVIVPRIIELSKMDKIIVISTHDSNIAVRTLPLVSIYREDKKTYQGNLFSDLLINENGEQKSWIDTSLDCLEGGDIAFDERSKSYGKN